MTLEWTFIVAGASLAVIAGIYGVHILDERKWAREAAEQAKRERTHPAE